MREQDIERLVLTPNVAEGCKDCSWLVAEGKRSYCRFAGKVLEYMERAQPMDHSTRNVYPGELYLSNKRHDLEGIPEGHCLFDHQTLRSFLEGHLPDSVCLSADSAHQFNNLQRWTDVNPLPGIKYILEPLPRSLEVTYP